MLPTTTLTMVDGVRVTVPDSLELLTTYVLREQRDWFEDEIKFLRRLIGPAQKAIDIGANYGVYTLCIAKLVGAAGHVWAFEPASATAQCLAASIADNGFCQVSLVQSAVSSARGTARLSLNEHSELNALQSNDYTGTTTEEVAVVSLDDSMQTLGWKNIDFMKIDAEGEEINIVRGAARFLAQESPLIQYEIKVEGVVNLELVRMFGEIGYPSYRLVPGLDLLVPFDAEAPMDRFALNLFCCKPDRAARLAARGFLLEAPLEAGALKVKSHRGFFARLAGRDKYDWRQSLACLPYGKKLAEHWTRNTAAGDDRSGQVENALALYSRSHDRSRGAEDRYAALQASLDILRALCEIQPSYLRRASLARVARDYGARLLAITALQQLSVEIVHERRLDPTEPFLAPGERFDTLSPGDAIGPWICTAALEELERNYAFSSYYSGRDALENLQNIRDLHFGSEEMARRLELVKLRYGID